MPLQHVFDSVLSGDLLYTYGYAFWHSEVCFDNRKSYKKIKCYVCEMGAGNVT